MNLSPYEKPKVFVTNTLVGNQLHITWDYYESALYYVLLRGNTPVTTSMVQLAETSLEEFTDSKAYNTNSTPWYYAVIPVTAEGETPAYPSATWEPDLSRWQYSNILKARVRDLTWMQKKGGFSEEVVLFKKKVHGQVCTENILQRGLTYVESTPSLREDVMEIGWEATNKSTLDKGIDLDVSHASERCLLCFGTGIVGGYERTYDKISISRTNAAIKSFQSKPEGRKAAYSQEWWALAHPRLAEGDILVRQNNARFRVTDVTMADPINGLTIFQVFNLVLIQNSDITYNLGAL